MKKGSKMSAESRLKMSLKKKGKPSNWKGKTPSEATRLKMSKAALLKWDRKEYRQLMTENHKGPRLDLRGPKSANWRGGLVPLYKKIRQSIEYKLWREAVFTRDGFTCVWCGQKGGTLNADHIKPFAWYPELRFSIDNGRTLCVPCHKTTDTYGHKSQKSPL